MQRSVSIDLLKAIAIFGVVFIHSAGLLGCQSEFSELMRSLFRFCVPCFIVIWAYFVEKSLLSKDKTQQFQYLKKRFVHLFLVFTLWSLLYFFLSVNWTALTPVKVITTHFSGFGWAGQYYFIILFQLLVLFPLLQWIYERKVLRIVVLALSMMLYFVCAYFQLPPIVDTFGYRMFIYWLPYIFVGIALARGMRVKLSKWWLFAFLLVLAECYLMQQSGVFSDLNEYIRPTVLFIAVLMSVIAVQYNTIQYNTLAAIGRKTMIIFVANPLVILLLKKLPFLPIADCGTFGKIVSPFLSAVLVLCICLIIDKIIRIVKLDKILI